MLTDQERSAAYHRITRVLRDMHHTERTMLDESPHYLAILTAIHGGNDAQALAMAEHIHTERGDAWRARKAGN